jgi:hypothetical protein
VHRGVASAAHRLRLPMGLILLATIGTESYALWADAAALVERTGTTTPSTLTWLGWICDCVSAIAVCFGLVRLISLLTVVSHSGRFGSDATLHLRAFAGAVVIAAGATSLLPILAMGIGHMLGESPPGPLTVTGSDLLLLLIGLALLPIARLLASAQQAQDELDRII